MRIGLTLQTRLLLLLLTLVLAAVALGAVAALRARQQGERHVAQEALNYARVAAAHHTTSLHGIDYMLATLAHLPGLDRPDGCEAVFASLMVKVPEYHALAVHAPDGRLICGVPGPQPDASARPWFSKAAAGVRPSVGNFQGGKDVPLITVAGPMLGEAGELLGVLSVSVDLRAWQSNLADVSLPRGAQVAIFDRQDNLLISHPATPPVPRFDAGQVPREGVARVTSPSGMPLLLAAAPTEGGTAVVSLPRAAFLAETERAFLQTLIAFLLFGVAAILGAWQGSRRLLWQPIRRLTHTAMELANGNLAARTGLVRDQDEIGQLAAAFDRMAESIGRSEQANLAKSQFLAAASHDLRQPMQAMHLFHSVLAQVSANDRQRAAVDKLGEALESSRDLLSTLMNLSAMEAGGLAPVMTTVTLQAVFDRLADQVAPQAATQGLGFRVVATSVRVASDEVLLERMLRNLLVNALQHTQRGRIQLGCRRVDRRVRIEVWDTGRGIAADQQSAVFETFRRGPGDGAPHGLGLGLAIVRRMADLLGHRVGVRSQPGKGSVFWIEADRAG